MDPEMPLLYSVTTGPLPDMLHFSEDCSKMVVAIEGRVLCRCLNAPRQLLTCTMLFPLLLTSTHVTLYAVRSITSAPA